VAFPNSVIKPLSITATFGSGPWDSLPHAAGAALLVRKNTAEKGKSRSNNRGNSAEPTGMTSPAPEIGQGGEIHQVSGGDVPVLTTNRAFASHTPNSLRIGARGPTVVEDFQFPRKAFPLVHERIPECVVHARGFGAHGVFETALPHTSPYSLPSARRRPRSFVTPRWQPQQVLGRIQSEEISWAAAEPRGRVSVALDRRTLSANAPAVLCLFPNRYQFLSH
jgi:hypothetical protein